MAAKFKLQSVLNYRQSLEDQAQQVLTASLQSRKELEQQFQEQGLALGRYDGELRKKQSEGMTVAEMELFESQIYHCRRLMADLQQRLETLDRRIDEERRELHEAAQNRQIMEKLKEKQEAEYRQELTRKERDMLDEISLRYKGEGS